MEMLQRPGLVAPVKRQQIQPGAKILARAENQNYPRAHILRRLIERVVELGNHLGVQRVALLRPVQSDARDPVKRVEMNERHQCHCIAILIFMRFPRLLISLLLAVAFAFGQAAPPAKTPASAPAAAPAKPAAAPAATPAATADPVVLTIGAEKITKTQFEAIMSQVVSQMPPERRAGADSPQAKRQLAEQLAELKALAQEARRLKIDQTPEAKTQMAMRDDQLIAGMLYQQISKDAKPTPADLQAYYDGHKNDWETVT